MSAPKGCPSAVDEDVTKGLVTGINSSNADYVTELPPACIIGFR